jgi:hypothetical protein
MYPTCRWRTHRELSPLLHERHCVYDPTALLGVLAKVTPGWRMLTLFSKLQRSCWRSQAGLTSQAVDCCDLSGNKSKRKVVSTGQTREQIFSWRTEVLSTQAEGLIWEGTCTNAETSELELVTDTKGGFWLITSTGIRYP